MNFNYINCLCLDKFRSVELYYISCRIKFRNKDYTVDKYERRKGCFYGEGSDGIKFGIKAV